MSKIFNGIILPRSIYQPEEEGKEGSTPQLTIMFSKSISIESLGGKFVANHFVPIITSSEDNKESSEFWCHALYHLWTSSTEIKSNTMV